MKHFSRIKRWVITGVLIPILTFCYFQSKASASESEPTGTCEQYCTPSATTHCWIRSPQGTITWCYWARSIQNPDPGPPPQE